MPIHLLAEPFLLWFPPISSHITRSVILLPFSLTHVAFVTLLFHTYLDTFHSSCVQSTLKYRAIFSTNGTLIQLTSFGHFHIAVLAKYSALLPHRKKTIALCFVGSPMVTSGVLQRYDNATSRITQRWTLFVSTLKIKQGEGVPDKPAG